MKFFKKHNYKYINGTKGAISLFLVMMMLPFFSLATFLAEYNRFQSAKLLLDNSINSAAVSVLSDYDYKIYEKYGLMSINPWTYDVKANFKNYLLNNLKGVSKDNIELTGDPTIVFDCPLSDTKVLKRQIAEYSKYNGAFALADKLGDSDEIFKKLEDANRSREELCGVLGTLKKALEAVKEMYGALYKLDTACRELEGIKDYDSKWDKFVTKTHEYSEKLRDVYQAKGSSVKNIDLFPTERINAEWAMYQYTAVCRNLRNIVKVFEEQLEILKDNTDNYDRICKSLGSNSNIKKCLIKSLEKGKSPHLNEQLKKLEDFRSEKKERLIERNRDYEMDKFKKCEKKTEKDNKSFLEWAIEDLDLPTKKYEGLSKAEKFIEEIKDDTYTLNVIEKRKGNIQTEYPRYGYWYRFSMRDLDQAKSAVFAAKQELEKLGNVGEFSKSAEISELSGFFKRMLEYEAGGVCNRELGGIPSKDWKLEKENEGDAIQKIKEPLLQTMKSSESVFSGKKNVVQNADQYINLVQKSINLLNSLGSANYNDDIRDYKKMLIMAYFTSVLNNRFNYDPEINYIRWHATQCELEYVFAGNKDSSVSAEIYGQKTAFYGLYFTRFLLDIKLVIDGYVLTNIPYIGALEVALFGFLEPLIDTVLLVNDSEVELSKAKLYLSSYGRQNFFNQFGKIQKKTSKIKNQAINLNNREVTVEACTLSDEDKDNFRKLTEALANRFVPQEGKNFSYGSGKLGDYEAHMFLAMLLFGNEEKYLERFRNLVELYALNCGDGRKNYSLQSAYTCIQVQAQAKVKTIFPLPTAIDKGTFKTIVEGNQTRGY